MANLLSTGIYGFLCSAVKKSGQYISNFVTGSSGWMITHTGDAEFKSIYARDKIVTNEFVYNRIRVTEDEEIVSSNGKILFSEKNEDGSYTVSLDLREGDINPFAKDDMVIGYYHNPENSGIIYAKMMFTVKADPDTDQIMTLIPRKDTGSIPYIHMIIVRVGNLNNIDRQAFIMISSRTNAQYFYDGINSWDAYDDPDSIKCFLGKVSSKTSGVIPEWAQNALSGLRKFFLIADGVILRGTFILKGTGVNAGTYTNVESAITAIPGLIESKVSSVKLGGTNLMKRSSCTSKEPISSSIVDTKRPMAVNTDIYDMYRLRDGFAQIDGNGNYYWYVEPTNATTNPPQSGGESGMYNLWGGFTSSYGELGTHNYVAQYNDLFTLSFDYYIEGTVGDINLTSKIYWGTTKPGEADVTKYEEAILDKTPGVWHHCELTVDLSKDKDSVFNSGKNIFFQLRTLSGWGQHYAGWKMFHKNIQFEKGNKATDWTPAPEDFYEASDKANQAANEAKQAIGTISKDVTELDNYIDGAFSDGIISKAEAVAIEKYINTVTNSKSAVEATYTTLLINNYLSEDQKVPLTNAYKEFTDTIKSLIDSINDAIKDGKTTKEEKTYVDNNFDSFNTALASFNTAVEIANKAIQDSFNTKYTSIKQTVDTISLKVSNTKIGGRNIIRSSKSITLEANESGFNYYTLNLSETIKPETEYTFSVKSSEVISGSGTNMFTVLVYDLSLNKPDAKVAVPISSEMKHITFKTGEIGSGYTVLIYAGESGNTAGRGMKWTELNLEEGNMPTGWSPAPEDVEDEVKAAKALADRANQSVEDAVSSINIMVNDNIFSASEKKQLKPEWESIVNEKESVDGNAIRYGLYDLNATYQTAYTKLYNYVNPLIVKPDTNSPTDGALFVGDTFRKLFIAFYNARNALLNAIYAAAKQLSDELKDNLLNTGIDIANKKIVLTADKTLIRDNSGTTIALFEDGKIKADCISSSIQIRPFGIIDLLYGNEFIDMIDFKNYRLIIHESSFNSAYIPCDYKYCGYEVRLFVDVSSDDIIGSVILLIDRNLYPNSKFIYQGMDHSKVCYRINILYYSMVVISAIPRDGYVDWFVENVGEWVVPIL